jgi:phosphatidate cytidylyltransferase
LTRILSALVLLPVVLGAIWYSYWTTLAVGLIGAALAFLEYAAIAEKLGARVERLVGGVATVAAVAAFGWPGRALDAVLLTSIVTLGALSIGVASNALLVGVKHASTPTLSSVAASAFAMLYIGLPIGAIVALRRTDAGSLLLLLAIVVVSDTAQYYTGRLLGRRPLAPAISPKKTREGAVGGLVGGSLIAVVLGRWWLPGAPPVACAALGLTVAAAGIVGDLFESQLKRSAGVKDSSTLIPGHGGVLDRIDSWLFAGPVFYVFVRYVL